MEMTYEEFQRLDAFEQAGISPENSERLREISQQSGIDPHTLITFYNANMVDKSELMELATIRSAWSECKDALWDAFEKSWIGRWIIRLADALAAFFQAS